MATPCADCGNAAAHSSIRGRALCKECYRRFVSAKILKRMDTYRFRNQVGGQRRRVFVPLSGGVSSLVLLHVLDAQVRRQLAQQGRTAYEIVVGHVVLEEDARAEEWWAGLRARYALHEFLALVRVWEILEIDARVEGDIGCLGLMRGEDEDDRGFVRRVLTAPDSVTARKDLAEILLRRAIVGMAVRHGCESVVFGHSDSRLAALTLAEVAKGRGGAVPSQLGDGVSPWGVNFNYPVRDLFKSELEIFRETLARDEQDGLLEVDGQEEPAVSLRSTSIDALLGTYISSQAQKYPSIMANVVKTASKLQTPQNGTVSMCRLCGMPVTTNDSAKSLCYGCVRMKQDIKT